MAEPGEEGRAEGPGGGSAAAESGRIAFLDQALWKQFREAASSDDFARSWLALQCRMLEGIERGLVLWGDQAAGSLQPVAHWPDGDAGTRALQAAEELALAERRGVVLTCPP